MAKRLEGKLAAGGGKARGDPRHPPSGLPSMTAAFDTVVCTLVLCTVEDPEQALYLRWRGSCGRVDSCCSSSMSARMTRSLRGGRTG